MGRHSSPERVPFLRSVGTWALPWLLILAVIAIALVVVFDMVANDPIRTAADDARRPAEATSEMGSVDDPAQPETAKEQDVQEDDSESAANDREKSKPDAGRKAPQLITDGIDIQVLNCTTDGAVDDVMADKLARLGYRVVAVSPSGRAYEQTVVFWTADARDAGAALAKRFGWDLEQAPASLSQEVHLHVMVGGDRL